MSKKYILDGFIFNSEKDYKDAIREKNNIAYVEKKYDMKDVNNWPKVYDRLIKSDNACSIIGIKYLYDLREKIFNEESLEVDKDEYNIPIKLSVIANDNENFKRKYSIQKDSNDKIKKKLEKIESSRTSLRIVIAFLTITIIVMFIITMTSDNSTYKNAKNSVLDDYSSWQEQLEKREKQIEEKEDELAKASDENQTGEKLRAQKRPTK